MSNVVAAVMFTVIFLMTGYMYVGLVKGVAMWLLKVGRMVLNGADTRKWGGCFHINSTFT